MSDITKTVYFRASRETVWAFLTEKDKLALWFHRATADLAEGEDYTLVGGDGQKMCWGTVEAMDPPGRLVTTFTAGPLNGVTTTVTWTLEEVLGGTRLTLEHDGIAALGDGALGLATGLDAGWDEHFSQLRAAVSG